MQAPFELFAACQPGLEPLLTGELKALGIEGRPQGGGVAFQGDVRTVMQAGLWLGTASHVLMRIAQFPCRALGELQRKAALLPWLQLLRSQVPVAVTATTRNSRIYHTGAAIERIENAIAGALGERRGSPHPDDPMGARVHARFRDDICTLSLDATSSPLHRRGYRLDGAKAPLREDLAHALVLASGFRGTEALLDPFCGSGTIAIEAAALAAGLAPGRLRPPPLQQLELFDTDVWQQVHGAAIAPRGKPAIAAIDRDAGAIKAATANAERAGVAGAIEFRTGAFTTHPWLQEGGAPPNGVLVTNPPFGLRVPKADGLLPLYQTLGHRAARLGAGWQAAILAHDVRLARRTGMTLHAAFTTKHGGLSVSAMVGAVSAPPAAG